MRAAGGGRPSHRAIISLSQPQRPHAHRLLHTHFPSTASTSLQAISCSCSVRSMRSLRSARRFRLIMNTWGRKAAPAQPPSSRPEQGQGSLGPPLLRSPHRSPSCRGFWAGWRGTARAPQGGSSLQTAKRCFRFAALFQEARAAAEPKTIPKMCLMLWNDATLRAWAAGIAGIYELEGEQPCGKGP